MATHGGDLKSLRELNRLRVVDALQAQGTASRADLARRTGLSRSTVSTIIADLQRTGLVVETVVQDGAQGAQGRPPVLLALDPTAGAGIGVDFDHDRIRVAVADLSLTVLAEHTIAFDVDHDAERSLDTVAAMIDDALREAGVERERVVGIGMALAGPVDHERRVLHHSAILAGWTSIDPAGELERRAGIPVHLDNDTNLGARAEATLGACRGVQNAAFVSISSGIGAGLIVDGRIYRGHRGTAGELGHVLVDPSGTICRCGNRGCLETLASVPAVLDLMRSSRGAMDVRRLLDLARDGDAGARRAIGDAGRAVGSVLATLVNFFNPEMVVVGGDLSEAGEVLLGPLRASLERSALPVATGDLTVRAGELGDRANLLGAVAFAVSQSTDLVAARVATAS